MRRTPLRRTPFRRNARKVEERRDEAIALAKARDTVFRTAGWRCQVGWDGCIGRAEHAHHRLPRSAAVDHAPENLLAVCHVCHAAVHANPIRSYQAGFLVRRGSIRKDPE